MFARLFSRIKLSIASSRRVGLRRFGSIRAAAPIPSRSSGPPMSKRKLATGAAGGAESGDPGRTIANDMIDFINASWSPWHATDEAAKILLAAGFKRISERDEWRPEPNGKYFFTRNMSTLVAFAVGGKYVAGNGFVLVGAHTDSPCLRLKPVSKLVKSGCLMLSVQPYGGGLWHTWFDRDLSVAGRLVVSRDGGKRMSHELVRITRPILRIPSLAIHLDRTVNDKGFLINLQTQAAPLLATAAKAALPRPAAPAPAPPGPSPKGSAKVTPPPAAATTLVAGPRKEAHHALLLELLAAEARCAPGDILDAELCVVDTQPGAIGGALSEFVFSGRLDNLHSSFVGLRALVDSCASPNTSTGDSSPGTLDAEPCVRALSLFDHEEVGSDSAQGAGGPVVSELIRRVTVASGGAGQAVERALRRSFLVSADMAHAVHPNYADKHDGEHGPVLHAGMVIKHNASQRYATSAVSAALFREIGLARGLPVQEFSVRADTACGSTIGPILAAGVGLRTVDCGAPQLSMHSAREMCGVDDVAFSCRHLRALYDDFSAFDARLAVDEPPE